MGNLEKLVVLAVLFLTAIVLGIALNPSDEEVQAAGPLEAAEERRSAEAPTAGVPEGAPSPSLLLTSESRPAAGAEAPESNGVTGANGPVVDPELSAVHGAALASAPRRAEGAERILKRSVGLERSRMDDYMIYTVAAGDTWAKLAEYYYLDRSFVPHLRTANEDLEELRPGERILVPIYDLAAAAGTRERYQPIERPAAAAPAARRPDAPGTPAAEPRAPVAAGTYEVRSGDNLSKISQAVYGTPHRWREIWQANRTLLPDPDWLEVGMELAIPR